MGKVRQKPALKRNAAIAEITQWILDGTLKPGQQVPYRAKLEKRFGVTTVTLQEAFHKLREDGFVTTRGRWGTFVAEKPPCFHRVGLAFPSHPAPPPNWSRFWHAILKVAKTQSPDAGMQLAPYFDIDQFVEKESVRTLTDDIAAHRMAGLIFAASPHEFINTALLADDGMPRVSVAAGTNPAFPWIPATYPDYGGFFGKAFRFMAEHNRRRVAVATISPMASPDGRYAEALRPEADKYGIEILPAWTICINRNAPQSVSDWLQLLMEKGRRTLPQGLVIADDHLTPYLRPALDALNLKLRHDLEIISMANAPMYEPEEPGIRYLGFKAETLMAAALNLIEDQRRGRKVKPMTFIDAEFLDTNSAE